jgi:ATP-dependent DNA ligase
MEAVMFKPMLAAKLENEARLKFPLLASQKLDGIRATAQEGQLFSRKLKPIPNVNVQRLFITLPEGLDGELIVGDPCAPDCFRKTTSLVMSDNKPLDYFNEPIHFYVFDYYTASLGFSNRLEIVRGLAPRHKSMRFVEHVTIVDLTAMQNYEEAMLEKGAEGIMLRKWNGRYKQGRSTELEGDLIKVKRFLDSEAVVIGFEEEMHNTNTATVNELGRTKRSHCQAGMVPKNTLGALIVTDVKTGVTFNVGGGFDASQREAYWQGRKLLKGKIARYKYFPSGGKDKPRHPIFTGWRHKDDM